MIVHYMISDGGDGSASLRFFRTAEAANQAEENDPETFGMSEGGGSLDVTEEQYARLSFVEDDEE